MTKASSWRCMLAALLAAGCGSEDGGPPPPGRDPVLPRTGQTTTYVAGDDGDLEKGVAWPATRFIVGLDTEADCVTDNLTGLMWVKAPDSTQRTWQDALGHSEGLTLCGHDDWRLPNRNELSSLLHYGEWSNVDWLLAQGFVNVLVGVQYWTSTTYAPGTTNAWVLRMPEGNVYPVLKSLADNHYTWPVRDAGIAPAISLLRTGQASSYGAGDDGGRRKGAVWPSPRFTTNADTSVTDELTGLVWAPDGFLMTSRDGGWDTEDAPDDGKVTWPTAMAYVAKLNGESYLGRNDWRLPNVKELESVLNAGENYTGLWLDTQGFAMSNDYYWSSTTFAQGSGYAWMVDIARGQVAINAKSDGATFHRVWPVRSGY